MRFKVYKEDICPACSRSNSAERISRRRIERLFFPGARKMKCRLCLHEYLVKA